MTDIAANLANVYARVDAALIRGGRTDRVTLVAVSKTVSPDRIVQAHAAGQHVFGENRVQEAAAKIAGLSTTLPGVAWHLIGHLQTNKAGQAARLFDVIESVDSERLAGRLSDLAGREGRRQKVLLEVNVAGEASKHGFTPTDLRTVFPGLLHLPGIEIRGLMTVAPLVGDPEDVRPVFAELRSLRDDLADRWGDEALRELSMGMSNDFEVAVEEGATMVRVGRGIFGERPA